MTRYRVALWGEDRLLGVILAGTATLSAWIWWVPIRAMIEGTPFEWSNNFGMGRILVLALLSGFFISVIYSGWRGARAPFKATVLFWTGMNLVDSLITIARNPAGYRFRGDTWGIDLDMATFMPALQAGLVLTLVVWLIRDARSPRVRSTPPGTHAPLANSTQRAHLLLGARTGHVRSHIGPSPRPTVREGWP